MRSSAQGIGPVIIHLLRPCLLGHMPHRTSNMLLSDADVVFLQQIHVCALSKWQSQERETCVAPAKGRKLCLVMQSMPAGIEERRATDGFIARDSKTEGGVAVGKRQLAADGFPLVVPLATCIKTLLLSGLAHLGISNSK